MLASLHDAFCAAAFTGAQAQAVGVNRRQLMYLAEQGIITRLHRDTYCADPAAAWQAAVREACVFVQRSGVTPVIGGMAAASLWNMNAASTRPLIWVPMGGKMRRGKRGGVTIREGRIHSTQQVVFGDDVVTSPVRTAVDLACELVTPGAITWTLCEGMRRECEWLQTSSPTARLTAHQLAEAVSADRGREELQQRLDLVLDDHHGRGINRVKRCSRMSDPRLESALEAESWVEFHRRRLPLPQPQALVYAASGRPFRIDFKWGRVLGEADGAMKYRDPSDVWREKRRQDDLEQAGFIVVRWTWAEITYEPHRVISRIKHAMARDH